jgi:glycosyltransferase involved in cell wall biosynthesis
MRILHLTTFLQGGAGAAVRELAIKQQATGHAVAVVTTKTGVAPYGNNPEHLQALARAGVSVFAVDSLFRRDFAANLNVVGFIQQRLGPAPFDIMHAHASVASVAAIVAASGTPARVLQTVHGWGVRKSTAQTQSDVAVLRQLPRVVARDQRALEMLVGLGLAADRLRVIPYGVRPYDDPFDGSDAADPELQPLRDARASGRPIVCAIGTVGPHYNQRLLVDALTILPAAQRPFCIVIGGGEVGRLTLYARTRGVDGAIRFCGYQPNARRFLRKADCLVVPCAADGLPMSAIEAFCDRVPVVAASSAELCALTENGAAATLFAPDDAARLAEALRTSLAMAGEQRDAMRHAAHEIYRAQFTAAAMSEQYEAEYRQLLIGPAVHATRGLAA